ncbi:uncharacterized protein LOC121560656 [Coregonus clupeaformis]|uniref:uncharacterized protein LOC121560656 n=1 Tax=Coregonus clupeaformis TaxID=59861 RepID=UPI001E1C3A5E|nr:uncharacterized protein LOC121560656 [Coregonus clupeaformis]
MLCQLWTTLLSSVAEMDFTSLLGLCGNELHLPVQGERRMFERAEEVMKQSLERVHLCLHWGQSTLLSEALSKTILDCLSHINKLRFTPLEHQRGSPERLETEEKAVLLDLCLQAALDHRETFQRAVNTLLSLFSVYQTERYDILLDLYSHVKDYETQTCRTLSFRPWWPEHSKRIKFLVDLLSQAAEWEEQTGEKTLKLVSSVWTYSTFPFLSVDNSKQSDFLLDLFYPRRSDHSKQIKFLVDLLSQAAEWEEQTGEKTLKLVSSMWTYSTFPFSDDEDDDDYENKEYQCDFLLDLFLQCLPYISQLSCDDDRFFQRVCESVPVRSREEDQQLASLLQALGSTLSLGGELPRKTCRSVGRVLGLCASRVDLTLTPSKISLQGALLIVRHESKLHKLRLNVGMAVKLSRLVRRTGRGATPLTVPELSLVLKSNQPPERVLSRALSSVASLLRLWRVQCLDLTDFWIQGHSLITLLCHQGPLSLRLNSDTLQQLTVVVYEAQDKDLTQWFLEKVGGDLPPAG